MSPSEVSRLLELLMEVRDAGIRVEGQIGQIQKDLSAGANRMEDHSSKFPAIATQITELERSHNERLATLERANQSSDTFWSRMFEPIKLIGIVVLTLAATALYGYFTERLHFDTIKAQAKAAP